MTFKNGSYTTTVLNCPPLPISKHPNASISDQKPGTKMVGQPTIGAAGRLLVRMQPIRVEWRSVRRSYPIQHTGTAHAGGSRIKIPCSIPSAVARRPVCHTVAVWYRCSFISVHTVLWVPSSTSSAELFIVDKVAKWKRREKNLERWTWAILEVLKYYRNNFKSTYKFVLMIKLCQVLQMINTIFYHPL